MNTKKAFGRKEGNSGKDHKTKARPIELLSSMYCSCLKESTKLQTVDRNFPEEAI